MTCQRTSNLYLGHHEGQLDVDDPMAGAHSAARSERQHQRSSRLVQLVDVLVFVDLLEPPLGHELVRVAEVLLVLARNARMADNYRLR